MSNDRFDVLERFESLFEAPEPSFELFLRRRQRKQRNQRIAGGVVGFAVLVALVVSLATVLPSDHTQAPADTVPTAPPRRRGFIGLPPEGAPRSTPESGELVASMWSHSSADPAWGDGWFYVYADGRLIWQRYREPATGWLEQRLTPEGVELVRSEIISTGLFDPDQPAPGSELGLDFPFYGDIQVRNGDRLVYLPRRPTQEWTSEFDRLHERFRNLQSWLPARAWEDREIRGYVPSTYAICLSNTTGRLTEEPPIEPSSVLSLLPAAAKELLGGARHWRWGDLASEDPSTVRAVPSGSPHCFEVATEEARALAEAFDAAGIKHDSPGTLIFRFDAPDPISRTIDILFLPQLPHGVPAITGG